MRGGKEDPDVAVSLWEDAHWPPQVKVVQLLASWEEYSASALTFPPHHHPLLLHDGDQRAMPSASKPS